MGTRLGRSNGMVKPNTSKFLVLCLSTLAVICLRSKKIDALSLSTKPAKFATRREILSSDDALSILRRCSRGGAIDLDDDYDAEEYDVEEYDSDSEVEEDVELAASAVAAVEKAKKKKAEEAKRTMNKAILKSKVAAEVKKSRKKSPSLLKRVPYIFRAFINPFTVLKMTRGYFASLFNIDYLDEHLDEDSSQNLRSALEEKAKRTSMSGGKRARKMRPGQAKTLSDLPQLSA